MASIELIETPNSHLIIIAKFPSATTKDLFSHFTEADKLSKWWPQEAETVPREGGMLHLQWPAMKWHLRGSFEVFEPKKNLVFTWQWDHDPIDPPKRVKVRFEEDDDGTTITLEHGNYNSSQEDQVRRQEHIDGWKHFLGELAKRI